MKKEFTVLQLQQLLRKFGATFTATAKKPDLVAQLKESLKTYGGEIMVPAHSSEQTRSQKRTRLDPPPNYPQREPSQGLFLFQRGLFPNGMIQIFTSTHPTNDNWEMLYDMFTEIESEDSDIVRSFLLQDSF